MSSLAQAPATTPAHTLAELERLAHYHARTFGADRHAVRDALKAWCTSHGRTVRAATIGEIADHVIGQYGGRA